MAVLQQIGKIGPRVFDATEKLQMQLFCGIVSFGGAVYDE